MAKNQKSLRRLRGQTVGRHQHLAKLLILASLHAVPAVAVTSQSEASTPIPVVVDVIRQLEGQRDPKCHATASRLEDFIYGTHLSDASRFHKNDLQKKLVTALWTEASNRAHQVGLREIPLVVFNDARKSLFDYQQLPDENWQVEARGEKIVIDKTDKRHYATVAYALRALLAAEQDQTLNSNSPLVPLSREAVEAMKEAVDLFTLAVLQKADREARDENLYQIEPAMIDKAWRALVPENTGMFVVDEPSAAPEVPDYGIVKQTIAQKLASFEQYNQVSMQVFLRNLQVYFARHRWPDDPKLGEAFRSLFTEAMVQFSHDLTVGAENVAIERGHPFMRAEDVSAFVQRFIPHRINEYEDAVFFPALTPDEQVYLEAYDMDSFRDGGLHWRYLQYVIEAPSFKGQRAPDPFAMELLTENIAQFGVLLLRETGRLSKAAGHERLHPDFLNGALRSLQAKINANVKAASDPSAVSTIASSEEKATPTRFADATNASGIKYRHRMSDWLSRQIRGVIMKSKTVGNLTIPPAFQGSGVATEDIDGDGLTDVLLLGGLGNRLYRNQGDGTFADITAKAGLDWNGPDGLPGESRQPIIADFDNDGKEDILITYVNAKHRLYRNLGNGRFEDVTESSGLGGEGLVGGPATALDFDKDGQLDLYIGYFGDYLHGNFPTLARRNSNALPNKLFRNTGNFHFEDVTAGSGVDNTGWAQAVGHTDLDGDGWQDIIVGNDFGVNAYYRNLGNGRFEEISHRIGTDKPSYTMGIGIADLNADSLPDIYISNIVTMNKDEKYVVPDEATPMKLNPEKLATMRVVEANDLFLSHAKDGRLERYEHSDRVGRGYSSTGWAWDADFFDMDNDGDEDLYVLNGMNPYNVYGSDNPYFTDAMDKPRNIRLPDGTKESNVLLANMGGMLQNVSSGSGVDLLGNSRSAAYFDYDGDGKMDIIVNNLQQDAVLYRNGADTGNHWLSIRLSGDPGKHSTRDAIGAHITVFTAEGKPIWREVQSTIGYLSGHPKEQHFGVGKADKVKVVVEWPNGDKESFDDVAVDQRYTLAQGAVLVPRSAATVANSGEVHR